MNVEDDGDNTYLIPPETTLGLSKRLGPKARAVVLRQAVRKLEDLFDKAKIMLRDAVAEA